MNPRNQLEHLPPASVSPIDNDGVALNFKEELSAHKCNLGKRVSLWFVYLPTETEFILPQQPIITKIIAGQVMIGEKEVDAILDREFGKRSCIIDGGPIIHAKKDSYLLVAMIHDDLLPVTSVDSLATDGLLWRRVEDLPWGSSFKGVEFYNIRGWKLSPTIFVQAWAAGPNVNCGDHNHSELLHEDAFCEIHLTLFNGTGRGGMVCGDINVPLLSGEEHGPFWQRDSSKKAVRREDGSVVYPFHRWQGGPAEDGAGMDVWLAFEDRDPLL